MKPIVKVNMKYNNSRPVGRPDAGSIVHAPASWTATVDKTTLPEEFRKGDIQFEASGFARSQALTGVEKLLHSYSIPFVLEVQG